MVKTSTDVPSPTAAFASELERALHDDGAHGIPHAARLSQFLAEHKTFDFLNTPVDEFLNDLSEQDESFRQTLKAVQRVLKLAPTFQATATLLADQIHSAQKIYRMGKTAFVKKYKARPGFTETEARAVWNHAADTYAAVLTIVADLNELERDGLPRILQNNNQAISIFPNWYKLFQGDECEECRSATSPAYLYELLQFLGERPSRNSHQTVKDILFTRRPDLGYLELSCENSSTPLPYIDIVCEVLENAVAVEANELELVGFTTMPGDPNAAKSAIDAAFAARNIDLGGDFSIAPASPREPTHWVVHGNNVSYLLKKKATPNFFAEILHNTKTNAATLRAHPQYINLKAYEILCAAKYPLAIELDLFPEGDARRLEQRTRSFALPFDLFAEEVRISFQKSNLPRWDLMRTFRGIAAPYQTTASQIAAEYFGINTDPNAEFDELRLIVNSDPTIAGQEAVWGEEGRGEGLDHVSLVGIFLSKTGLEYDELLKLLDLKFINPEHHITIAKQENASHGGAQVMEALTSADLDRIHRFLRMWQKLNGWKMWELDLVLRNPNLGNGALDENFLVSLFYFCELKKRFGAQTTVEELCALFGNLNIESHFVKPHEKRGESLYQTLFLNKTLGYPPDRAFEIDSTTDEIKRVLDPMTGLPITPQISEHATAIMAALGIGQGELERLIAFTKASDGTRYINGELSLSNLSFLWRQAWLGKQFELSVDEWLTLLSLSNHDLASFASPQAAWDFVQTVDELKRAGLTIDELKLNLNTLALDPAGVSASLERFLETLRISRLCDTFSADTLGLLDVLQKLNEATYVAGAADNPSVTAQQLFAADVTLLRPEWRAVDVESLVAALDLNFPADYIRAASWERMQQAFAWMDKLNANPDTLQQFAAATMTDAHAKTIQDLLRSKLNSETWLTLSIEIQDALRERKRDALEAYLLSQPTPADAPNGEWGVPNDLHAYYLLDVEMNSHQMTTRLAQAAGSVQLFAQRCLMGLEAEVVVQSDDSAWRWWKWLSEYRVWKANREIFLYPENWIEPELSQDDSIFQEFESSSSIQTQVENLLAIFTTDTSEQIRHALEEPVRDLRANPFDAQRIVHHRPTAYQKAVVMKYLDNLIASADALLQQPSAENIEEATRLYVRAAEILGPRPKKILTPLKPSVETFNELESRSDDFSNAPLQAENLIPMFSENESADRNSAPLPSLYFGIAPNEKILRYWDTLRERLYQIHHMRNNE